MLAQVFLAAIQQKTVSNRPISCPMGPHPLVHFDPKRTLAHILEHIHNPLPRFRLPFLKPLHSLRCHLTQ